MERENHCENCGFDLATLDLTVLYARKGMEARKLHCPICRSDRLRMTALDRVFPRAGTGRWVRWREGGSGGSANVIPIGRLKLKVESEIESLSKEQVCFRAVPVFALGDGRRKVPTLPVMPEYLDCLDPGEVHRARQHPDDFGRIVQERGRAKYQCVLPLRGLKPAEWPTYECDLLPANPLTPDSGDVDALAFKGVSVRVWPNLRRPTHAWRYYVVSAGAVSDQGLSLFAQGRSFRARMLVPAVDPDGRPLSETSLEILPLDQEQGREGDGGPTGYVGATRRARPHWVAMEFYTPAAVPGGRPEPLGGGLIPLAPAADIAPSGSWTLGLDFGTSNTVVAIKHKDGTMQCIAPERGRDRRSTTLHLVDGGLQTLHRGLDLWPGGEWSGPAHDLLPSELGCVKRWTDVASEGAIRGLAFGRDFGVPLRGAIAAVSSDQVVSEFKWLRAVQKDKAALAQRGLVQALQARFLEVSMLMTSAALLAEDDATPQTVNCNYSFPLAFDESDLDTLRLAADTAGLELKALTGADFVFPPSPQVDEAQAAAGHTPSDKMFRVYLDLGGGSLEVLVDDTLARTGHQGHAGLHPHVFSTSLFFGGSVYLRSLVGAGEGDRRGACVMPGMSSYTRLSGVVRQSTSGRAFLDSPQVIAEARRSTAERRARAYIGYIIELVARVLAGVCLEHGRARNGGIDLSHNRLFTLSTVGNTRRWILGTSRGPGQKRTVEFSLVLLGNGWGFGDIVRDGMKTVEQMVSQRVYERLTDLLTQTPIAREITDGTLGLLDPGLAIEVSYVLPAEGTHRKAAVALGLLAASHSAEDAARFFKKRAPGRHGVLGVDLWLPDSGRRIPWYRPFGQPADDDPSLMDAPPAPPPAPALPTAPPYVPASVMATPSALTPHAPWAAPAPPPPPPR